MDNCNNNADSVSQSLRDPTSPVGSKDYTVSSIFKHSQTIVTGGTRNIPVKTFDHADSTHTKIRHVEFHKMDPN